MKRNFVDIKDYDDEEGDEESDTSEKEVSKKFESTTAAVIYLIDAREKMFLPSFEEAKLPISRCLESVRIAIRNKIFRSGKCLCSVILLGTKKGENPLTLNNLTVVQEFELLGAHHILKIDELIKDVENLSYEGKYGYDKFSLGDALWLSSHIFNQKSRKLNKTIVLFTNDENPTSDDPNDENRAVANAQDMYKSFVTFDLVTLGKSFDYDKFYKKILQASKNDANCVIPDPVVNVSEIVSRISKTNFKHVNLVKLPFVISDDFQIGVSVHFLVKKSKIPFKIKLSKATNERVTTKTEYFEEETGSVVKGDDLIKSQVVAQMDINFRPSELRAIQNTGKKEIRLLGFKPVSVLRLENFVKPCAFIYPDDTEYKGSSVFFTALLKRCIAKQVVAICTFCSRTTSSYRFVALIAQDECPANDKTLQLPPGFIVFFLPFAEEVRTIDDKTTERATPEQVEAALKLIKKLKFSYKVNRFQNPKLQCHWAAIEALALDLKEPEEVGDCTIPDYDLISQRVGPIAQEFVDAVYEEDYQPESFAIPRKPKPKLVKPETAFPGRLEDVEDYVRQGKVLRLSDWVVFLLYVFPRVKYNKELFSVSYLYAIIYSMFVFTSAEKGRSTQILTPTRTCQGEQLSNDVLKSYLKSIGVTKGLSKIKKADMLEKIRERLG